MKVAQTHALAFFKDLEHQTNNFCLKLIKAEPSKSFFAKGIYKLWLDTLAKAKNNYNLVHTNRLFVEYSCVHAPADTIELDSMYKELFMNWFLKNQLAQLPVDNHSVN